MALIGVVLVASTGQAFGGNTGGHHHGHHSSRVDCDKPGRTLQRAVDKADIGDTIRVKGTCTETVVISTDRLTIVADGAAVMDGSGSPDKSTIEVRGRNVTVRGFVITAGRQGIEVNSSGSVIVEGNDISGAAVSAVHVTQSSYARVGGADATVGNTLRNSLRGITIRNNASADVFFNAISDNDRGIDANANGTVDMADNTISGNDRGLSLGFNATAVLSSGMSTTGGANTFTGNATAIRCRFGGSASGGSPGTPQIDGGGNGVLIDAGATTGPGSCHVSSSVGF